MGLLSTVMAQLEPSISQFSQFSATSQVAIGVVSFITIATVLNVVQQIFFADPNKPPVVFHIFPYFGSTIVYGMEPYKFFFNCKEKYGDTFTFILLGRKMTVCLGPKGNDFIFNGKLSQVNAEEAYTNLTTPVFGTDVVYDCPNAKLMDQKRFMKFGLTSETFRSYVPLIVQEFNDYFQNSPLMGAPAGPVDMLAIIPELTIFTAARTLQGKEIRDGFTGEVANLYHDLDMGFTPMNAMFPWFPFPQNKKRDAAQRKMAQKYMDIITKRRKQGTHTEQDMLWNLMNQKYKDGTVVPDKEVAHMMIALLMAGQHTSMATVTWMLLHMAARPDIVQELYEEQERVFGEEMGPIEYDKLSELTLHNFVIKETLRIHPPLHSIMRKVKSPMHVANTNWVIPDTHFLMAAPGVSAIDPQYFKNPLNFDPHRWHVDKSDVMEDDEKVDFGYGLVSKGASSPYLPFGAGRHRCIGEQFANVQIGTLLAMFVRTFKMRLPDGQTKPGAPDYTSMIAMPSRPATVMYEWRDKSMKQ